MRMPIDTRIDPELCTNCGNCVAVCPHDSICMENNVAKVCGEESIGCDHCAAACPEKAITVGLVEDDALTLSTVESDDRYIKPADYDAAGLFRLMCSRRSCRNYQSKQVPEEVLEDLVKTGITAPSGTNSQLWTFTILPDRKSVLVLGQVVANFFRKLNRQAEKAWMRTLSKIFMKDVLGQYYRDYYERIKEGLQEFDEGTRERLFHGAPAVILVGSEPEASCPAEDALLASQNILLAAHAMGLGTCLIGFVVEAIKYDPRIKRTMNIPKKEKIHAVIALGYPNEKYYWSARRRKIEPRYFRA